MDRAEAIKELMPFTLFDVYSDNLREACSMAIAALREKDAADTNVGHKNEWSSVKERLPEYTKRVIVCDIHAPNNYIGIWSLEKDPDDGSDCWEDNCGWWQPFDAITHWMPLPEPPKEGAAE